MNLLPHHLPILLGGWGEIQLDHGRLEDPISNPTLRQSGSLLGLKEPFKLAYYFQYFCARILARIIDIGHISYLCDNDTLLLSTRLSYQLIIQRRKLN